MKELVNYIVYSLVSKPDKVNIEEIDSEGEKILELRVDEEDIGKVIGKNGRIARALRTVLTAASIKNKENYSLEIVD